MGDTDRLQEGTKRVGLEKEKSMEEQRKVVSLLQMATIPCTTSADFFSFPSFIVIITPKKKLKRITKDINLQHWSHACINKHWTSSVI